MEVATRDESPKTIGNADLINRFKPIVRYHSLEAYKPCSIEFLLPGAQMFAQPMDGTTVDWDAEGTEEAWTPSPDALGGYPQPNMRLHLAASQYPGQDFNAPMYACVQSDPTGTFTDITYIFLFAYNGPQTARAKIPYADFNCMLPEFAEHEADIESFTVRLSTADQKVISYRCEAHGDSFYYTAAEMDTVGDRAIIGIALNSHGVYNLKGKSTDDWVVLEDYEGLGFGALFIDILPDSATAEWTPSEIIEVGIDAEGQPVNGQRWVLFQGRLGRHRTAEFQGGQGIGGDLSGAQKGWVDTLVATVSKIAPSAIDSNQQGAFGAGSRSFIHQNSPAGTATAVAVRLSQRPQLALTADAGATPSVTVAQYIASEAQAWMKVAHGDEFILLNTACGLALTASAATSPVGLGPFPPQNETGVWSQAGEALRPAWDEDQNLNVLGYDDHPQPDGVGIWNWGGGDANETWRFDAIPFTWPLDFDQVVIGLRARPYLLLTQPEGSTEITVELSEGRNNQLWNRSLLFSGDGEPFCSFVNLGSGQALFAAGENTAVGAGDPEAINDYAIWGQAGDALRPIWDNDQNLNVMGDSPGPGGQVGTWDWSGGDINEAWTVTPSTSWPPAGQPMRLVCQANNGLTVVPQDDGSVLCADTNASDPNQVWVLVQYADSFTLVHQASGRYLHWMGPDVAVQVAVPNPIDAGYLWDMSGPAIRPVVDSDQNLNLFSSSGQPAVGQTLGTWEWGGGDANETWYFEPA